MDREKRNDILRYCLWSFLIGLLTLFSSALLVVAIWYDRTFNLDFKELLYTMMSPLKGTGQDTVNEIIGNCLPPVLIVFGVFLVLAILVYFWRAVWKLVCKIALSVCVVFLIASIAFSLVAFRIPAYVRSLMQQTTIYEDYYVDPNDVLISADGKTKNLIYVYAESLETTYASVELGGLQPENYMWRLTNLANRYVSFSNRSEGQLGGIYAPSGTDWTMASLLATTS